MTKVSRRLKPCCLIVLLCLPIFVSAMYDIVGAKVTVNGTKEQRDKIARWLSSSLGTKVTINEAGEITVSPGGNKGAERLRQMTNDPGTSVELRVVDNDNSVSMGAWNRDAGKPGDKTTGTQDIDIKDLEGIGNVLNGYGLTPDTKLMHEITEVYEGKKNNLDYTQAHDRAVAAEEELMKEHGTSWVGPRYTEDGAYVYTKIRRPDGSFVVVRRKPYTSNEKCEWFKEKVPCDTTKGLIAIADPDPRVWIFSYDFDQKHSIIASFDNDTSYPTGVAYDGHGNLYVCESLLGQDEIRVVDSQGNLTKTIKGPELSNPKGISVDKDTEDIFVAADQQVLRYSTAGVYLGEYHIAGHDFDPTDVAIWRNRWSEDRYGTAEVYDIFVSDRMGNIYRFNVTSDMNTGNCSYVFGNSYLATPEGLTIDSLGQIWIASTGNHRIYRFLLDGNLSSPGSTEFFVEDMSREFYDVEMLDSDGIYAVDEKIGNGELVLYNFNGTQEKAYGTGTLQCPESIAIQFQVKPENLIPFDPRITDTLYEAQGPEYVTRADTVSAFDTCSRKPIFNVYETLICMGAPVANAWGTWNIYEQYWDFSPRLATNVPQRQEVEMNVTDIGVNPADPVCYWFTMYEQVFHIDGWVDRDSNGALGPNDVLYVGEYNIMYDLASIFAARTWHVLEFVPGQYLLVHHYYYDFNIRTTPTISFFNGTGDVVDTFDILDAEYSLKRGLVQDQYGSPMWMFYKPFFDQMNSDWWNTGIARDSLILSNLIESAIEVLPGTVLRLNVGLPFPDSAFKQIICGTWASMVSREYSKSIGCWNGSLFNDMDSNGYPDWWDNCRHISSSPYDAGMIFVGTGPYRVAVLDLTSMKLILERNSLYWRGWPSTDRRTYLERIEIDYILDPEYATDTFIVGRYDVCDVPRIYNNELLDTFGEPMYPGIKTIKNILPVLCIDALYYTFTIDQTSPYIGTGSFPDGIPTDFFNNTHVRRAFSYGLNHSKCLTEVWLGEGIYTKTPLLRGLIPDYYNNSLPAYDVNFAYAEAELKSAIFEGGSVWDSGFSLSIVYDTGNDQLRTYCNYLQDFFAMLSFYDGRVNPPFEIQIHETNYSTYRECVEEFKLPIWSCDRHADFADADSLVRSFMCSQGDLAYFQNYTATNGWGTQKDSLIDLALTTSDGPVRAALYNELQTTYLADCPSLPVAQPVGRRWHKYWVKGWYYNALYPGDYYYELYKEDTCQCDITGSTIGVPDGICNMRDVSYIAGHFGAKAPDPGRTQPYDPKWAPGTYGIACCDVHGDRKIDMRDIASGAAHFMHTTQP